MSIIPKVYKNAVVPIGIKQADGGVFWIGTGFFVTRKVTKDKIAPFLITNKHVLSGLEMVTISMKKNVTEGMIFADIPLVKEGVAQYFLHPKELVDIAVLPMNAEFIMNNNLGFPSFDIDEDAMSTEELRNNGVEEGSLVHMLGFTLGLVNEQSHHPICRLGCIARMSEDQVKESQNILIDIQNFNGNSGSPIILRPDALALSGTKNLLKSVLIGIVHSYILSEDKLLSHNLNKIVEIRNENSGLANAHPVEIIREVVDTIILRQHT